ncbi:hypothetical protein BGZ75_010193 [Mortierella antarctica]|nr:hypothetical protein BGZ75_010193 [Mortierella antarctica]
MITGVLRNICLDRIVSCYRQFMAETGQHVPDVKNVIRTSLAVFLRQVGDNIRDTLQAHVRTNITELVDRLREYNPKWISCDEAKERLQSFAKTVFKPTQENKAALDAGLDWRRYVLYERA